MTILKKAKEILISHTELIEAGIKLAEDNIGHGKNDEKKAAVINFVLIGLKLPCEINLGFTHFNISLKIVELIDDIIQQIFDKLKKMV